MRNEEHAWLTEFEMLKEYLARWPADQLIQREQERRDKLKEFTWYFNDVLVAKALTQPDNRMVKLLWPNIRLN